MKRAAHAMLAASALSAVAWLAAGCGGPADKSDAAAKTEAPKPSVATMIVGEDGGAGAVRAAGMVSFQREMTLSFRTPGLIREILVDEGDRVRQGQALARLDLKDLNASLAEAETAVRNAESQLTRDKSLFDRGFIAQARLDASDLSLARARTALTAVRFNRDQAVITAPANGVVLRRLAEPNQNAAAGAPVLLFGSQTEGVIVRAGFSADAVGKLAVGDLAQVRLEDGAFRDAKVSRIAAKSDAATAAFDVEVSLNDGRGLRSGQVGEVLVQSRIATAARIVIPTTALLDARADQGFVFILEAGDIARRRPVRTAGVEGENVVIAAGLKPGDVVIVAGAAFVRDGQAIAGTPRARDQ
jgi:RND family efflux transporter MFP subunit